MSEMTAHWALLRPNEDGNPFRVLSQTQLDDLLGDPEGHGVTRFYDLRDLDADHNYWPKGAAVLMRVEVVVPRPAVYRLPEEDR